MFKLILLTTVVAVAYCASVKNSHDYGHAIGHKYDHGHGYGHSHEAVVKPAYEGAAPYNFGYDIHDDKGNTQSRKESGDSAGNQAGSYAFSLVDGRQRYVDYVADGNGFKAYVRSKEPGVDLTQSAADVNSGYIAPAPVKVVKKVYSSPSNHYTQSHGYNGGYFAHGHGHGYGHGHGNGHGYVETYNKPYAVPSYSYGHHYVSPQYGY